MYEIETSQVFGTIDFTITNEKSKIQAKFDTYHSPEWISTPPLACAVFKDILNVLNIYKNKKFFKTQSSLTFNPQFLSADSYFIERHQS